jgi:transcriptional regulator with PAS, ATPase and Fis domain
VFREDLYYRLNVFPINSPAARSVPATFPVLSGSIVDELSPVLGKRIEAISPDSLAELQQYSWPGNIRELRNLNRTSAHSDDWADLTIPVPLRHTQVTGSFTP